jgi:hypothetical protein
MTGEHAMGRSAIQQAITLACWFLSVFAIMIGEPAMAIEEPEFVVELKSDRFEIRQYRPIIVAETFVDGDLDAASSTGFRRIAAYIFGENQIASVREAQGAVSTNEKIAMTAPVTVEPIPVPARKGEPIAMTAPVTVEPQAQAATGVAMDANRWRIHFVMPRKFSMATLPRPTNSLVMLREVPAKRYAVLSFAGFAGLTKSQGLVDELAAWVKGQGLRAVAAPQMARYDPPWQLPFFRRNEILLEIATP